MPNWESSLSILLSMAISMFCSLLAVSCIGSLLPTAVSMPRGPTLQPGCHVNGQFHPEGSSYQPSACKHCFCSQGREVCAIADCFFTPCVDPVHKPDVCCPICPNGTWVMLNFIACHGLTIISKYCISREPKQRNDKFWVQYIVKITYRDYIWRMMNGLY